MDTFINKIPQQFHSITVNIASHPDIHVETISANMVIKNKINQQLHIPLSSLDL